MKIIIIIIICLIFYKYILHIFEVIYNRFYIVNTDAGYGSKAQRLGAANLILNKIFNSQSILNTIIGNGYSSLKYFLIDNTVLIQNFTAADNQYLTFLYEVGIIGVSSYVVFLIYLLKNIKYKNNICKISIFIFWSISINMFFYEPIGWKSILILWIIATNVLLISEKKFSRTPEIGDKEKFNKDFY